MTTNDKALTLLVFGASKAGKSTLAVTAPTPRLYLDVESASRFLPIQRVYWDPAREEPPVADGSWDTCVVQTRDWSTVEKVYQWLVSGKHPFESLIIDSISELQTRFIENVSGRQQLSQQAWGDVYRAVGGLVRDIRDLTMHPTKPIQSVVMTAMMKEMNGRYVPWCQGQLQTLLPYLMDVTGYLWAESRTDQLSGETIEVRKLLTRRTDTYEAGERVGGRIDRVIENPNVSDMIKQIFGPTNESSEENNKSKNTTNQEKK
jgi:hypothetical protein